MIELLLQAERALSVGLLDRAETLYRQVAAADPRNSIAVVGLARVALERGDERGALELGRRALVIDPENDAAQRLVQRLEEVRAYRGEPTEPTEPVETAGAIGATALPGPMPEPPPAPEPPAHAPEPTAHAPEPTAPAPEPTAPAPEPATPEPAPAPEPAAQPTVATPPHPRKRSWLDRLLRRNR